MDNELIRLRDQFSCLGIKAEFEAEGSSYKDLVRLRRATDKVGLPLFVKIGGVEALRDTRECYELGVDGIIAPMVESVFGAKKFIDMVRSVFKDTKVHKTLNIETKTAIEHYHSILQFSQFDVDSITFGRTDLSNSYMQGKKPDDVLGTVMHEAAHTSKNGMLANVGGSITQTTLDTMKTDKRWYKFLHKIETRKVMLPTEIMLDKAGALDACLSFESAYIEDKQHISDSLMEAEITRLKRLKERL